MNNRKLKKEKEKDLTQSAFHGKANLSAVLLIDIHS